MTRGDTSNRPKNLPFPSPAVAAELLDLHPAPADLRRIVELGLQRHPKQLPAWLLYDDWGSQLFDRICEQPEYSLTRLETALLAERADAIAASLGPGCLVEFGAGSARKVSPLLRAMAKAALRPSADPAPPPAGAQQDRQAAAASSLAFGGTAIGPAYVALDISAAQLAEACRRLAQEHPNYPILGICCDYSVMEELPNHPLLQQRRIGFYPGSSIGNFAGPEATSLLQRCRRLLGRDGQLLIGLDQPRDVQSMEAAYHDQAGVSAAFAFNLLTRLNHDLAGDFQPDGFVYRAWWQAEHSRIAMALISQREQTVRLAGRDWRFAAEEPLITEYSVKYNEAAFTTLAQAAGWQCAERWTDPSGQVALVRLVPASDEPPATPSFHL
ncbi:MAG: L-histidine N(alpha)-methyltransferase [Synechococcaceae cyanobacterium]